MKTKFDSFIGLAKNQETTKVDKTKNKQLLKTTIYTSETLEPTQPVKRGRPNGKRSDEQFRQVTAYINVDTYKKTKIRLFEEDNKQEFSELVDKLLQKWLTEK